MIIAAHHIDLDLLSGRGFVGSAVEAQSFGTSAEKGTEETFDPGAFPSSRGSIEEDVGEGGAGGWGGGELL